MKLIFVRPLSVFKSTVSILQMKDTVPLFKNHLIYSIHHLAGHQITKQGWSVNPIKHSEAVGLYG